MKGLYVGVIRSDGEGFWSRGGFLEQVSDGVRPEFAKTDLSMENGCEVVG